MGWWHLSHRAIEYSPQTPVLGIENVHSCCCSGEFRRLENNIDCFIALSSFPEVEGESLLLKTPHTLDIEHKKFRTRTGPKKPSFLETRFHGMKKCYGSHFGRKQPIYCPTSLWYLWTTTMSNVARYTQMCNRGTYILSVAKLSNWTQRNHAWY